MEPRCVIAYYASITGNIPAAGHGDIFSNGYSARIRKASRCLNADVKEP
jgi:hypothetical protein